jgi:putative addiction module component (TIGR02574 family)
VSMTLDQIVEETRQWPGDVVAELVDRIMLARHGGIEPKVDTAWHAEIQRRIDDIRSGREPGVPGEEVMARARKIIGR